MKLCSCFIFFSLLALSAAGETCYKYNSYYGSYYRSYCSGYCAGSSFSEYCLYYYDNDGDSGGGTITIDASVGGSIGGIIFFVLLCYCFGKK